jgi:hypothetical protein
LGGKDNILMEGLMSDPQDCWTKLRELADAGSGDPRKAAAKIVHKFSADASKGDVRRLRVRLEDTLDAGRYTTVAPPYLDQHSRWLAVLEGACAEIKAR